MGAIHTTESEEQRFEALYLENYKRLHRNAVFLLKDAVPGGADLSGYAEEVVQETFSHAWQRRDVLFSHPNPTGWLYMVLFHKSQELQRANRKWSVRILRLSEKMDPSPSAPDFRLRAELRDLMSEEEYLLMKQRYLYGYTYKELSDQSGEKISTLAMRIKRAKERIAKNYEES